MKISNLFFYLLKINDPINLYGKERYISEFPTFYTRLLTLIFHLKSLKLIRFFYEILNVLKDLYSLSFAIFFSPIFLLLKLNNLYFIKANTWQIGACIQQIDSIVKKKIIENPKAKFVILSPRMFSANRFLNYIYKSKIYVVDNLFLYFILFGFFNSKYFTLNSEKIEISKYGPEFNFVQSTYFKKFKKYDFFSTKKFLKKFNFKKKSSSNIICLHIKDDFFYKYKSQSSRSVNKKKYLLTVKYLLKKNFKIIHFTNNDKGHFSLKNPNYIKLNINFDQNKLLQIYYLINCKFFICTQSGPASFANLFNIPTLITNVTSYNHFFAHKKTDLVLLKKIFDYKNNKFLKFKKIFGTDLSKQYSDNQMSKCKLKYIQNSELDILNATKEMIGKTNNNVKISKLQIDVKKIIPVNVGSYYTHSVFPNSFITKNLKLFL